jgi:hypothetical protein
MEIRDRSAKRRGAKRARHLSRREVLKGAATLGLTLGARSAPAQSGGPITLNLLLWEHWKVAEGLQKSDPTNVPKRRLWFYETIKRFEAEHKEIKLQYQTGPTGTWRPRRSSPRPRPATRRTSSARRAKTSSRSRMPASWRISGSSSTTSGTSSTRLSSARPAP